MDYESPEYHLKRHHDLINNKELSQAWSEFADNAYFSHVKKHERILEFGSGVANNLLTVKKRVASVIAVEPSILGREIALNYGITAYESMDEVKCQKFNTILCRHVLEHVEQPKLVLEILRSHLTENGVLVLVLPVDSLNKKPKDNDINQHLYCWNPRTIHNLALRTGLQPVSYHYETYGAKKCLLPIYRIFGANAYIKLVRTVGKIFGFSELVYIFKAPNNRDIDNHQK